MTDPLRAGIYCRLSLARDGDTTKVEDQGGQVAAVPHDPEQGSASRYGQGCRCPGCRAAHKNRLLFYQWRRRNLPKIRQRLAEIETEMKQRG